MIEVGQIFPSATHLHQEVEDLSIEEKFRFLTVRHDRVRVDYRCSQHKNGCAWRVAAWVQGVDSDLKEARVENAGIWKVSIMERLHNCVAADENVGHPTANTQSWLVRVVPQLLTIRRDTALGGLIAR